MMLDLMLLTLYSRLCAATLTLRDGFNAAPSPIVVAFHYERSSIVHLIL